MRRAPGRHVRRHLVLLLLASAALIAAARRRSPSQPPPPDSPTPEGSPVAADWKIRGAIVGTAGVIDPGELTVKAAPIPGAAAGCPTAPGVPVYDAGGAVFPGLVDIPNHTAYDFLPQWTPPHLYTNRSQWESDASYAAAK